MGKGRKRKGAYAFTFKFSIYFENFWLSFQTFSNLQTFKGF